jgi:hypothetical protein
MRNVMVAAVVLAMSGAAFAQEAGWTNLETARKTGKPVIYLRILGELEGKL